jgi:hypothetical protein
VNGLTTQPLNGAPVVPLVPTFPPPAGTP